MDKVFDVINVCCYCCLILLFVLTCFPNNDRSCEFSAAIFRPLGCLRWKRYLFVHYFLLKKNMIFRGVLSVPRLLDIHAKNVDWRGRNFMCERTLPSLFVFVL